MSKKQSKDRPDLTNRPAHGESELRLTRTRQWRLWGLVGAAVIIAVALGAYSNSFQGAFVFDDEHSILKNPSVREFDASWAKTKKLLRSDLRPAVTISLGLNYHWGQDDPTKDPDPWGFHLVNLIVHTVAAMALFGVVRRTLLTDRLRARFGSASTPVALAAALIWMVHPLQTGSVTYIVQRAESAMGMFFLLTLYCAIRSYAASSWRRWLWYGGSVAACVLGMWSKQVMAVAPVVVAIYDMVFISRSPIKAYRRHWPLYVCLFATWYWTLIPLLRMKVPIMSSAGYDIAMRERKPLDYAVTQFQVILHYIRLCFWPHPQCLDYYWQATSRTLSGLYLPAAGILGLLAATGVGLWKRPALGFLGAWFFLILSPSSTIVPLADIAFEHRLYLPLAAVVVGVVAGGYVFGGYLLSKMGRMAWGPRVLLGLAVSGGLGLAVGSLRGASKLLWPAQPGDRLMAELDLSVLLALAVAATTCILLLLLANLSGRRAKLARTAVGAAAALAAVAALGHMTVLRNQTYHSEAAVWRAVLKARPGNPRAHNNLGKGLYYEVKAVPQPHGPAEARKIEAAGYHFAEAIRLEKGYADPNYNRALLLTERADDPKIKDGRFKNQPEQYRRFEAAKIEEAVRYYKEAIRLKPNFPAAHNNLAILYDRQATQFRLLANSQPARAAQLLAEANKLTNKAIEHYRTAIHYDKRYAFAYNNLGSLYNRQTARALIRADRLHKQGQVALAARLRAQALNDNKSAMTYLGAAMRLNPYFADLYGNLGLACSHRSVMEDQGEARKWMDRAIAAWQKALQLDPKRNDTRETLAQVFAGQGNLAQAAEELVKVIQAQPGNIRARGRLARILYVAGRYQQASVHYRNLLSLKSDYLPAIKDLAWLLATAPQDQARDGALALKLAQYACKATANKDASCLDILAAAHAELGQFGLAVQAAQRAAEVATRAKNLKQAEEIRERLKLYASAQPVRLRIPP